MRVRPDAKKVQVNNWVSGMDRMPGRIFAVVNLNLLGGGGIRMKAP